VANTEAQVFGAVSFNGGVGFQANELISQGSSRSPSFGNSNEYGDYNGLAFRANKYFYIWSDNSNSTGDNANGTRSSPDIYTAKVTIAAPRRAQFDFDGDAKTDISIFRPNAGEWWINRSSSNQTAAAQFGQSADKITPGDFTGDGKTDIAFWRPDTGVWFVLRSENGSFFSFPFGANGDIPVPADYDNDGRTDAAVFRPSTSTWYIQLSSGGTTIAQFGAVGDVPEAADYDGDG
jgi:hypothetical protein